MKLLIIGASGVLGSRLYKDVVEKKWDIAGTYYSHEGKGFSYLDIADKTNVNKIFSSFKPEVVVLCGGITDVDLCEETPSLAESVNIKGTVNIANNIKEYGSKLVLISTDYIFNGDSGPYSEEDRPSPINVYGRTKLEAENVVIESLKEYLIIRTAQLYGADYRGRNFTLKIIKNMMDNKKVYAADDLYSTPTYSGLLSGIIIKLIEKDASGIYNGAGSEFIDRYDYVNNISDVFKLDKNLIQRVKLKDLKLKAERPKRGGLRMDRAKKEKITETYDCKAGLMLLEKELSNG